MLIQVMILYFLKKLRTITEYGGANSHIIRCMELGIPQLLELEIKYSL